MRKLPVLTVALLVCEPILICAARAGAESEAGDVAAFDPRTVEIFTEPHAARSR